MNNPLFYTHDFLLKYATGWTGFCLLAAVVAVVRRQALAAEFSNYVSFLAVKWKLLSFLPAFVFVTCAGRFTDDPTWDVISGGGMALLTFLTAPWAVGVITKVLFSHRNPADLVIAVALWFFSSCWFYDGYLFFRDGRYTDYWLGNLMLSPFIYLAAGLLWNLEAKSEGGFRFSFLRGDWPKPPLDRRFLPLLPVSIPFVVIAVYLLVAYVGWPVLKPVANLLGFK